jgi:hypothetical protein
MALDNISQLLRAWSDGDQRALDELTPIVYAELRRLAHRYMRGERPATASRRPRWSMKPICAWWTTTGCSGKIGRIFSRYRAIDAPHLVEHARRHNLKRGRGVRHVSLDEAAVVAGDPDVDLVALDDALNALARVDPRKVRVVEMRFSPVSASKKRPWCSRSRRSRETRLEQRQDLAVSRAHR